MKNAVITTKELSELSGYTVSYIHQMNSKYGHVKGLKPIGNKLGRKLMWDIEAVEEMIERESKAKILKRSVPDHSDFSVNMITKSAKMICDFVVSRLCVGAVTLREMAKGTKSSKQEVKDTLFKDLRWIDSAGVPTNDAVESGLLFDLPFIYFSEYGESQYLTFISFKK